MIVQEKTIGDRLEDIALRLDRHPVWMAAILAGVFIALIAPSVGRHLDYDELHTFYIAQAPTWSKLAEEIRTIDLQPPLTFVLVRGSIAVLGPNEIGARLPIIIGSFLGSLGVLAYAARRVGPLWGAAAVGLFWISDVFYINSTARPYGILLGFFGLLLVSWDSARTHGRWRRWAITGVSVGVAGMLASHVFAVLWIAPFWAAELVRSWRERRIDKPLWCALLLPLAVCITYLPLVRNVGHTVFPPALKGSAGLAASFYVLIFLKSWPALLFASLAALAVSAWRGSSKSGRGDQPRAFAFPVHESVLLVALLLPPVILNVLSALRNISFFARYGFPTILITNLLVVLLLAYKARGSRLAGFAAALVILAFAVFLPVFSARTARASQVRLPEPLDRIHPELPLVANSAFTFLEMDHYEKPPLVARLHYLVDEASAMKYSGSNLTEGIGALKAYFPIRSNIESYSDFAAAHHHFLVWGEPGEQQGWLLTKLKAEAAQVDEIGFFDSPYPDSRLYEVRLDP